MASENILSALQDGVLHLELNRPEKINSFDRALAAALLAALSSAVENPEVRVILLSGAGKGFCAGQDLAEVRDMQAGDLERIIAESYNPLVRTIWNCPKPVVCLVHGIAAGAGANLAFCCDLVVAEESAHFIQAFIHVGLIPDTAGTYILPRRVGLGKAKELAFLGEKFSAQQAHDIGLVQRIAQSGDGRKVARALCATLALRPPRALAATKQAFHAGIENTLEAQLSLEFKLQGELGKTDDYREGVSAFLEKRTAEFKGS